MGTPVAKEKLLISIRSTKSARAEATKKVKWKLGLSVILQLLVPLIGVVHCRVLLTYFEHEHEVRLSAVCMYMEAELHG